MKPVKLTAIAGCTIVLLLSISGCGTPAPTYTSTATKKPTATWTKAPTTDPYETWSTNFASVTDPAAGIWGTETLVAVDTTNVNSGGKSIKAYGTIGGGDSCLNLAFGFQGVVGRDSVDLSDKTLSLEIYLPANSPLDLLMIFLFNGGKFVSVRTAVETNHKGQWHTYTVDVREDITLRTWRSYSYMTSPGLTDDEAVGILKNAETIAVIGSVLKEHTPAESYFLVDRLGWEPAGPAPAYDPSLESLRKYAPANLPIGGLMEPAGIVDPEYVRRFVQEFNGSQAWGVFPAEDPGDAFPYDESWSPMPYADYFNETQGMKLIRYTGIGENPEWVPDWLPGKTYEQTQRILETFTYDLVDHYKGKTDIWIVFNELLKGWSGGLHLKNRNVTPQKWVNDYSPFSNSESDVAMIEAAFRVAKEADPGALLIINDGGGAMGSPVGEYLYALVAKLKSDGTPIDGVGFEDHITLNQDGKFHFGDVVLAFDPVHGFTDIEKNVERYAALGLKVAFTEEDVSIYLADIDPATPTGQILLAQRRTLQAAAYRSLLHIALTHPNVVFFNLWDWADEYAWTDQETQKYRPDGFGNDLGLFDLSYQKKLSYYAMLEELKGSTLPGPFLKYWPANGSSDQTASPTLSWTASWNATSYEYCIDASDNDSCDGTWKSAGADTSAAASGLTVGTTYYWQVRASNADGVTDADGGTWRSFTVSAVSNLALQRPVIASSREDPNVRPPEEAVDGDFSTRWASAWSDPQWIQVDLGGVYDINRIVLYWESSFGTAYEIQVSDDGAHWTTIYSTTTSDGGTDAFNVTGRGRYVRMYGTERVELGGNRYGYSLWEFEVYGS